MCFTRQVVVAKVAKERRRELEVNQDEFCCRKICQLLNIFVAVKAQ